jgi:hypothetical protein
MHNEILHNESEDFFWREPSGVARRESIRVPHRRADASISDAIFLAKNAMGFLVLCTSEICFPKFEDSARRDVPC